MKIIGKTGLILMASTLVIAACTPSRNAGGAQGFSSMKRELGASVNEGSFGNPTYNNMLVQSAYRDQNGLLEDLGRKFEREVPTMINFDFDSTRLDAQARAILDKQAEWIKQFPEIKFRVYGHTDLVGTKAYNKRLGLRRAQRVVAYLTSRGISRKRLEAVASFGETQPLVVTEGRERRNRRTVTQVIGFAVNFKGDGLDGKYARLVYRTYVGTGTGTTDSTSSSGSTSSTGTNTGSTQSTGTN